MTDAKVPIVAVVVSYEDDQGHGKAGTLIGGEYCKIYFRMRKCRKIIWNGMNPVITDVPEVHERQFTMLKTQIVLYVKRRGGNRYAVIWGFVPKDHYYDLASMKSGYLELDS